MNGSFTFCEYMCIGNEGVYRSVQYRPKCIYIALWEMKESVKLTEVHVMFVVVDFF